MSSARRRPLSCPASRRHMGCRRRRWREWPVRTPKPRRHPRKISQLGANIAQSGFMMKEPCRAASELEHGCIPLHGPRTGRPLHGACSSSQISAMQSENPPPQSSTDSPTRVTFQTRRESQKKCCGGTCTWGRSGSWRWGESCAASQDSRMRRSFSIVQSAGADLELL